MKIYTRKGDDGGTSLWSGERVGKDALRVEAYGSADELCAVLGCALAEAGHLEEGAVAGRLIPLLRAIQDDLFTIGADLARSGSTGSPPSGTPLISDADVSRLEQAIDRLDGDLSPLRKFILPGGSRLAAWLHLARTVCRRTERVVVHLSRVEPVRGEVLRYLNRLSDLLFVMARSANAALRQADPEWEPRRSPQQ